MDEKGLLERGEVYLEGAELSGRWLKGADFHGVHMKRAFLWGAKLQGANFEEADLKGACLKLAKLQGADLSKAKLQGVDLSEAKLESTIFNLARVDGETSITKCDFDKYTNFSGVGLDAASIMPELKAAFKDNIRRIKWQEWFCQGRWWKKIIKTTLVRLFWYFSNYGSSTSRIIIWFLMWSSIFAGVYFTFEVHPDLHGIIQDLRIENNPGKMHVFWRALYFSIVTMTTLGFGDMHAVKNACVWGFLGSFFLSIQVMLGYLLLGALVTRLGVLFTSEAPATKPKSTSIWRRIERTCTWRTWNRIKEWQKGLIFTVLVYALMACLIFR